MAEARYEIRLAPASATEGIELAVTLLDDRGSRLRREQLHLAVEGYGSFAEGTTLTEKDEQSNDDGEAHVTWWKYPRPVPRPEIKAIIKAACNSPGCEVGFRHVKTIYGNI